MSTTQPTRPVTSETETSQPRPLWRNRDYLLLLSGQVVSLAGTQFSLIAFPLLALFISGSPAQAGLIGSMRLLPYLILSLPAGALTDRWDRKRVMQICDAGRAISLASIPIAFALGHLTIAQLYVVSLIEGTLFVFFDLAEVACLPRVVAREQVVAATAQNEVARNISFLLGPALGGALYGLGKLLPFALDAFSYLFSVCSLFWIKAKFQEERGKPEKLWLEIRAGLVWIWHQPLIFFIAITGTFFHIFFDGYALVVIVLAQQMHAAPFMIGIVLAMDGVGSMLGSLLASRLGNRLSFRVIASASHWIWAALWLTMLLARDMVTVSVILALMFVVTMVYDLTQFSYRRMLIPDELQGRVNSVFRMIAYSGGPLGLALAGFLLQFWGPYVAIAVFSAGAAGMALIITLNPHMRRARSLSEVIKEHRQQHETIA
ncbi:MAG TPA: MFS transporter [Ktedonobacteraceae bacterium]